MRTLTETEQQFDYAKYYALTLFPPSSRMKADIQSRILDERHVIPLAERRRLLECEIGEEYLGYGYLDGRFGYVSTCTYMPNVTPEMIDWWFVWHGQENSRYVIWDKEDHYSVQSDKLDQLTDESLPMKRRLVDVTHKVLEDTGCGPEEITIHFQDPKEFFDPVELEKSSLRSVIWANGSTAVMCHTVFPNPKGGGVALASHFWIGYNLKGGEVIPILPENVTVPEPVIRGLALHSIKEYAHLGYMLPYLYAEQTQGKAVHLEPVVSIPANTNENQKSEKEDLTMPAKSYSDLIVDTAIKLYLENGTGDLSFSRIDRELGQYDGFTFQYFLSQKELNEKCIETMSNRAVEMCCELLANREKTVLARLDEMFEYLRSQSELLARLEYDHTRNVEAVASQLSSSAFLYQKLTDSLTAFIREGKDAGSFKVNDPRSRAAFIAYGLLGLRSHCASEADKIEEFQASTNILLGL